MMVTAQMLWIVCPLVFLASCIDAIAGGGGLISLTAYQVAGLPPVLASGSNKMSACMGTLMAAGKFLRGGQLLLKPALCAIPGAIGGAYVGAMLLQQANPEFVRMFMLIAIPVVAVVLLFRRDTKTELKPLTVRRLWICALIGLACGFYDGFFGPGTGTFLIMLFTWCLGMDAVAASGTAKLVNLASNLSALVSFLLKGEVLFALALPAMCCSIVGGYVGAHLTLRIGARFVKGVMVLVLSLLMVQRVLDMLGINLVAMVSGLFS